jgi:hypothetical protein
MAYWRGSTSPLLLSGSPNSADTWTSQVGLRERHDTVLGSIKTDQAGTLHVEQSLDGVNWDFDTTVAVVANTGAQFNVTLVAPYWRLRMVNTAGSNQTFLRIAASTQAGGDS